MNDEEEEYDDEDDDTIVFGDDTPWQAPYAWSTITGDEVVPDAVHAAAVAWFVDAFKVTECPKA